MTKTDETRRALLRSGLLGGLSATATANALTATNSPPESARPGVAGTGRGRLRFALLGDNPYGPGEVEAFRGAITRAAQDSAFLIHVGDIKSGIERCDDDLLAARLALLNESSRPLILALGDNEWTDCSRFLAGSFDPLERLNWLRIHAFNQAVPLGGTAQQALALKKLHFENQSAGRILPMPATPTDIGRLGLPENQRWVAGPARFVSLNVAGSRLGLNSDVPHAIVTAHADACRRWLAQTVALASAEKDPVLVVVLHAEFMPAKLDPRDFTGTEVTHSNPYGWLRQALYRTVVQFDGTVILLHGDTHRFVADRPWRKLYAEKRLEDLPSYGVPPELRRERIERFARVRAFGTPASSAWVQIEIEHRPAARTPVNLLVTPWLM